MEIAKKDPSTHFMYLYFEILILNHFRLPMLGVISKFWRNILADHKQFSLMILQRVSKLFI